MEAALKHCHKLILSALIFAAFLACLAYSEKKRSDLKIYFLDIGQGDAVYVRSPSGKDMLVDGGPSNAVLRRLSEAMPWFDRTIDVVVETHPDADHIGGIPDVMKRYRVGVFLEPGVESKNAIDDEIRKLRERNGTDRIFARRGMRVNFGDGASFDILYPDRDVSGYADDTNMASIVGEVRYGSTSVMLTGDAPKAVESRLVTLDGTSLRSQILKAGHHGSRTSSGESFVRAVSPEYAVISAGKGNRYGHPHKEVTDLFGSLGIEIVRTDELGTIEFDSDGESLEKI